MTILFALNFANSVVYIQQVMRVNYFCRDEVLLTDRSNLRNCFSVFTNIMIFLYIYEKAHGKEQIHQQMVVSGGCGSTYETIIAVVMRKASIMKATLMAIMISISAYNEFEIRC